MLDMMRTYMAYYLAPYVKNEEGQGMVEYALIIALIAVVLIIVLTAMSGSLEDIFTRISDVLSGAAAPPAAE